MSLIDMEVKTAPTGFVENHENRKIDRFLVQNLIFEIWEKKTENQVIY
jgi:hypothetical protein